MSISASMVKELREKTGAGMMDCKKALEQSGGDFEKAIEYLREKGLATAAKKAGRVAAEGIVASHLSADGSVGVLVEVNCETDFVARNEDFQGFVREVAAHIAANAPTDVEALMNQRMAGGQSVSEALTEKIAKIGENMKISRFACFEAPGHTIGSYIHLGGKVGVLVELVPADAGELAQDIAMQIAAMRAQYVDSGEIPADIIEKERQILRVQAVNEGKPEAIVDKMVEGRLRKFYEEVCLLDQAFIREDDLTVRDLLKARSKELGAEARVVRFARFEVGEGQDKGE